MDHKSLAALILRISGLLIIVYAVTNAAKNFAPFFNPRTIQEVGVGPIVIGVLVSVVVPVLIGLVLVYFPKSIANPLTKVEGVDAGAEHVRPLQRVAFSAIGLWLSLYAVIDATYFYAKARLYMRFVENIPSYATPSPFLPDDFGGLVSCAVQFVIGLWLLIGNRGLVNALTRLRG
jgi:hypothetical protein